MPHYMSFWDLVENSPEWVSAIAAVLLGVVTACIIFWQALVMRRQAGIMDRQADITKQQGNASVRLLKTQTLLIRWQHEHEWMLQCNKEREEIQSKLRQLELNAGVLDGIADEIPWTKFQDITLDLQAKLETLDFAASSTPADVWLAPLHAYLGDLNELIYSYHEYHKKHNSPSGPTTEETLKLLRVLNLKHVPSRIADDIESSIRIQFLEFKNKWDREFPP